MPALCASDPAYTQTVSFRSEWAPMNPGAGEGERVAHEEIRHTRRSSQFAVGTLACGRCDAPVSPGDSPRLLTEHLVCPFCAHDAPVRDFLTLGPPTRPAHVVLRVIYT
jgi:hypothetical protein